MGIQTDREIEQKEIKILNKKYNMHMFSSKVCSGKANLKNYFLRPKHWIKDLEKKIRSKKLIEKATNNLNIKKVLQNTVLLLKNKGQRYSE